MTASLVSPEVCLVLSRAHTSLMWCRCPCILFLVFPVEAEDVPTFTWCDIQWQVEAVPTFMWSRYLCILFLRCTPAGKGCSPPPPNTFSLGCSLSSIGSSEPAVKAGSRRCRPPYATAVKWECHLTVKALQELQDPVVTTEVSSLK